MDWSRDWMIRFVLGVVMGMSLATVLTGRTVKFMGEYCQPQESQTAYDNYCTVFHLSEAVTAGNCTDNKKCKFDNIELDINGVCPPGSYQAKIGTDSPMTIDFSSLPFTIQYTQDPIEPPCDEARSIPLNAELQKSNGDPLGGIDKSYSCTQCP